jgi:hypothetical protein
MSRETPEGYGLVQVGRIELPDLNTFRIILEHPEAARWECVVYAFLIGGVIVRIGSSEKFGKRISDWNRNVTDALNGRRWDTPEWEAHEWRKCLVAHNGGEVFARVGIMVRTPVGEFPAWAKKSSL